MISKKIHVTKTFLPPRDEFDSYVDRIWKSGQLTNQGPLLEEFSNQMKDYLGVSNFHFLANGTLALQLALRALDITEGEIITTPFSYVATTSAIIWEGCEPVYVDIEPNSLCIDPSKIEAAITPRTKAILPVHVFGNPCDIELISRISKKYNIPVIYDGAHSFGVQYRRRSLLSYGDISTCSFHSTKSFHTIEGGCVVAEDAKLNDRLELLKRFGHDGDKHYHLGINAKASEFQAAMGLSNMKYIDTIIAGRKKVSDIYNKKLDSKFRRVSQSKDCKYNYAYYPIFFESETKLLDVMTKLSRSDIFPRRYFYPSLNKLPYHTTANSCPISEDVSKRIVCLPLYHDIALDDINKICEIINQ